VAEHDAQIDRLYGLPLDEFVHERDELAKRLRREGDGDGAKLVRGLRKPTVAAWALNQAVRRRGAETRALLEAGERLRGAHQALLTGARRADLREAMEMERDLVGQIATCAEVIASEAGKSGPALRERVRSTLHSAALDEDTRSAIGTGRLVRETEAVGFGQAMPDAPAEPVRAKRDPKPAEPDSARGRPAKPRERRPSASERAAAELPAAERRLEEARDALDQARAEAADAAETHERARAEAGRAAQAEREARGAASDAERRAREAERAATKVERELARLRERASARQG